MPCCPYCSSPKVYRSQFGWVDVLTTVLLLARYKCRVCRVGFLRFLWQR